VITCVFLTNGGAMEYKTIGCAGQLMQGKDVLSDYLAQRLTELCYQPWKRNAFANKVKETFEKAFGKDREFVEKWKRIEVPPPGFKKNVRQCLIAIGDGFRQMKPNTWIEQAFFNQETHQVISDCRYINEANHIKENGGINILLWRDGYMNNMDNASEKELVPFIKKCLEAQHWNTGEDRWMPLEGELNSAMEMPFDIFIRNQGTIEDLKKKVDNIVIPLLKLRWKELFKEVI
jgi:hypothetical protein